VLVTLFVYNFLLACNSFWLLNSIMYYITAEMILTILFGILRFRFWYKNVVRYRVDNDSMFKILGRPELQLKVKFGK